MSCGLSLMASFRRIVLFLSWLVAASTSALAGAFLMEEGETQAIATLRASSAARVFDAYGRASSAPRFAKTELTALAEYGYSRDLTLILQSSVADVASRASGAHARGWAGGDFGGRLRLFDFGASVLSVQALALTPGALDRAGLGGARRAGADLRLLFGKPFTLLGMGGFLSVEGGARLYGGGRAEARFETTLGVRPGENWLILAQSYLSASRRDDFHRYGQAALKSDLSVVYRIDARWSAQVGYGATTLGRSTAAMSGPFAALWARF